MTWMPVFRVLVQVQEVLKGKYPFHRDVPRPHTVWLEQPNPRPPGLALGSRREYRASYSMARTRRGDRFLAYLGSALYVQKRGTAFSVRVQWADHIRVAWKLKKQFRKAAAARQRNWRKGARCKPLTYHFKRRCLSLSAIKKRVLCPAGSTAVHYPMRGRPLVMCRRRADGKRHGDFFHWHANGELRFHATYRNGKSNGRWRTFDGKGHHLQTVCYRKGRVIWKTRNPKDGETRKCPGP
jgi:hypothetical protein